jgi:hypothetical protein
MERYRVVAASGDRADPELLVVRLPVGAADPAWVAADGYDPPLAGTVASIEPGNVVRAEVDWTGDRPRFAAADVVERTRFAFARDATNLFEAAVDCWEATAATGEAMNSTLTRGTDGEVNGVCYVFADPPGRPALLKEFRDGTKPLDPLLGRIEGSDPPYEVFVIEPRERPFVAVYIALERGGLLARTVRETYDFGDDAEAAPDGVDGLSDLGGFDG